MPIARTRLRRPTFDLRFITETSEYHIVHDTSVSSNNRFMSESVISMRTQNAMEDDSAAFSFVLSGDMEWDKLLNANDMVVLRISPNEVTLSDIDRTDKTKRNTVMVGLISEVRVEGNYNDDRKGYRITGQSFAKALMQFNLSTVRQATFPMNHGWLNTTENGNAFFSSISQKTIAETARAMYDRFIQYIDYDFEEGTRGLNLSDRISPRFSSWANDERLTDPTPFLNYEGSLNQLFNEIVIRPFCEKFFEIISDDEGREMVGFYIRRTPFDRKDWIGLSRSTITSHDVVNEDVSHSDLDAYSVFNCFAESPNLTNTSSLVRPKYHPELVKKYGYTMLEVPHHYLMPYNYGDPNTNVEDTSSSLIDAYSERLYRWYAMNPNFYSGDITVIGRPDYRLGTRLLYKNEETGELYEYYIESVEHSFSYSEGYTTSLGVTRGVRLDSEIDTSKRFTIPQGPAQDFKGGYLGEHTIADMQAAREEANQAGVNAGAGGISGGAGGGFGVGGNNRSRLTKPAEGIVTSPYGNRRHPIRGGTHFHNGIDVAGGSRIIRAMADGRVTIAKNNPGGYGLYVKIDHGKLNGVSSVSTLYAHLNSFTVSVGQQVRSGQQIGVMGTTGMSTGVHLHFEVHENGSHVNPANWISFGGSSSGGGGGGAR